MITLHSLVSRCRRLAQHAALLPLVAGAILAQSSTGTITGRVYDEASGRSLQGAVVAVSGTNLSDYTDAEGRYSIPGVRAGAAKLNFEYVGLDSLVKEVLVPAGGAVSANAGLTSNVMRMSAFEVKEAARGQALAINQQKTAAGIMNIVSEEIFGNMIGGNPGYALQRLPGISVDEAQDGSPSEVNLRGVPGELNSFQVDGVRLPNSGGTGRGADMRQLVADGITNIEVMKAVTPDRDGDAIGGIINVVSRNAFQRDGGEYKLVGTSSYNDLSGTWGYNARATYSDIFGILGKEKNLGLSFTATRYKTDRYSENADVDWVVVHPETNPQLNLTQKTKFLEASHMERSYRTTHAWGVNGSIDFRFDEHNSLYLRPYFSHYDQNSETFETDWDVDTRFQDQAGGRKTYASLAPDGSSGRGTAGANGSRSTLGYIGTLDDSHNDLWSWAFGGRHEHDADLADLDADIEARERRHDGALRHAELDQAAREAETVDETEEKSVAPAPVDLAREEIFNRDINDRERDGDLRPGARQVHELERRERQRDRMRDGEGGHDLDDRPGARRPQNHGEQKT